MAESVFSPKEALPAPMTVMMVMRFSFDEKSKQAHKQAVKKNIYSCLLVC
jgi:hypothetical protein